MRTALCALALLTPALASAGNDLEVELQPSVQVGGGQPLLIVVARNPLESVRLDLRRSTDGRRLRSRVGPLRRGDRHAFPLPLKGPGEARYTGTLKATTGSGEGSMPIDVGVRMLPPLTIRVEADDLNLEARTLTFLPSRPVERVELSVMSDTGAPLGSTEQEVTPDESGKILVTWDQEPGRVFRISIKAFDADGLYGGHALFPWRVQIPHQEVVFETGKAVIRPSEIKKLKASLRELQAQLSRYGKLASGVKVFVAGHTDTVGDRKSNQLLSERRARAIGRWFRSNGIRVPMRYAGVGEDWLLIKTPDETDEVRNRRAEYIVAIDAPTFKNLKVRWIDL